MRTRPVASGPGTVRRTMPLLALRRKDSGRAIPSARLKSAKSGPKTLPVWPYRGRDRWPQRCPHANVRRITLVIRSLCSAGSYIAS
ncbi:hypothetical protein GGD65_007745 [Bradyrhizobium sp. CIR18]|nr:hypothetical protein [Bradyrhizobium sp. CIR3A]MBB4366671.1 hypothetical protein [Bradyrhizobium sp. CIR18]MBB4397249.1 hypothetical protein [Bradyrhizobium sp. ERR14]